MISVKRPISFRWNASHLYVILLLVTSVLALGMRAKLMGTKNFSADICLCHVRQILPFCHYGACNTMSNAKHSQTSKLSKKKGGGGQSKEIGRNGLFLYRVFSILKTIHTYNYFAYSSVEGSIGSLIRSLVLEASPSLPYGSCSH